MSLEASHLPEVGKAGAAAGAGEQILVERKGTNVLCKERGRSPQDRTENLTLKLVVGGGVGSEGAVGAGPWGQKWAGMRREEKEKTTKGGREESRINKERG